MHVYVVQHGQALPKEEDPERPLSDAGRAEVERVAKHLAGRLGQAMTIPIAEVHHSGKLRAQQTAEILAQRIAQNATLRAIEGLSPNDDPRIIADRLEARRAEGTALMLVGHLPHLQRLAGLLIAGSADARPIRFRNAGVVRLSWDGRWSADWVLWPELIG
jgi:phosphohistidine phosphatase